MGIARELASELGGLGEGAIGCVTSPAPVF